MKTILLLVHDDAGQEARLQAGLDIVRALGGHLRCLDIVPPPAMVKDGFGDPSAFVFLLEDTRRREADNRRRTMTRLASEDVAWSMEELNGDPADCVRAACALCDLIIVNSRIADAGAGDMSALAHGLATECDKPLLAVPAESRGLDIAGRVLVAWDGSPAAAEALAAAVPLLKLASDVRILSVDTGETHADGKEAAAYLSRYGVHAEVVVVWATGSPPVAEILANCAEYGPGLCVMGAYGHSRLREKLFGGVTRQMLAEAPFPLFLAH